MLDDIIEIVLDIVLNIVSEVLVEVPVPKWLQIVLGIIVLALVCGFCGVLIGVGIEDTNMVLVAAGAGVAVLFIGVIVYLVRKHRREKGI